jgi:hypothetical protein
MNSLPNTNQSGISKEELRILNIFWIGFILYTSGYTISTSSQVNYTMCNLVQLAGLFLLIPCAILLIRLKIENKYLRVTFYIYCFWLISVVIRGFQLEYTFIRGLIFNSYEGLFIYFTPFIMLFPKKLVYIKKVINVVLILGIIYVLYSLLFIKDLLLPYNVQNSQNIVEYFSKTLSIPCGFVMLTYIYHSNKKKLFAIFVTLLTFMFALYRARRALAFLAIWPVFITYIIYLNYSKKYLLKIVIFLLLVSLISVSVAYWQSAKAYLSDSSTTSWFLDRIGQDTRTLVEEYFYRDLKPIDWVIGKGINGKYYCPGIAEGVNNITIYRTGIETDYLTIILKGGLISLGLMILMAVPAIFKGLFHSKNLLSKAAAIWILFYLIELYPAPVTTFSLNYLLVWISIGICFSKELRDLPDDEIKEAFSD